MATRSCCSIPHTAAAGVRSATSEPAPCRSTKHSNASATIHTSWNYGRPTSERPQLIDTHDEHRSLETTEYLPHAAKYEPDEHFGIQQIWRRRASMLPEPADLRLSQCERALPSRSQQQRRGIVRPGALSVSGPRVTAGGTATVQARSLFPSCQVTIYHSEVEDHRLHLRR